MEQRIAKIVKEVRFFVSKLKGFKIEKAIIFGSRIKGDFLQNSDLDLILVSRDFQGIDFTDRIGRIYKFYDFWRGPGSLETLCYTPQELAKKSRQLGLVRDALKRGITISFINKDKV